MRRQIIILVVVFLLLGVAGLLVAQEQTRVNIRIFDPADPFATHYIRGDIILSPGGDLDVKLSEFKVDWPTPGGDPVILKSEGPVFYVPRTPKPERPPDVVLSDGTEIFFYFPLTKAEPSATLVPEHK